MQGLTGLAVKHHHRFPLVGETHSGEPRKHLAVAAGQFADHRQHVLPDFPGVMLNPPRLGINLPVRPRRLVQHPPGLVEQHGLGGRGALVDG